MARKKEFVGPVSQELRAQFRTALTKVANFFPKSEAHYEHQKKLKDDLYGKIVLLINHNALSFEARKNNSKFVAGYLRGIFADKTHKKNKRPVIKVFERISVWLDLSSKDKEAMYNTLVGYKIGCSIKTLDRFKPKPKPQKSFFDIVDENPTFEKIVKYSDYIFSKRMCNVDEMKRITHLLNKYKISESLKIREINLFGQTTEMPPSRHKLAVKSVLSKYKDVSNVNQTLLKKLILQTNFNDKEAVELMLDFAYDKEVVNEAIKERRSFDIRRLNSYVLKVPEDDKKDKIIYACHRSLYVSFAYQSIVEGKNIDMIDFEKEYVKQKKYLKTSLLKHYKENNFEDITEVGKWKKARNEVHNLIAKDDREKIVAIEKHLHVEKFIDQNSYETMHLEANLKNLKGDENSDNYDFVKRICYYDM